MFYDECRVCTREYLRFNESCGDLNALPSEHYYIVVAGAEDTKQQNK